MPGVQSMDVTFMESSRRVFKSLFDKGHVYRAVSRPFLQLFCVRLASRASSPPQRGNQSLRCHQDGHRDAAHRTRLTLERRHADFDTHKQYQIMPYSTALSTPLSHMESKQNERQTIDPAVLVAFPVIGQDNLNLVIYTTTPWTLPSNLLIAVHKGYVFSVFFVVFCGLFFVLLVC